MAQLHLLMRRKSLIAFNPFQAIIRQSQNYYAGFHKERELFGALMDDNLVSNYDLKDDDIFRNVINSENSRQVIQKIIGKKLS